MITLHSDRKRRAFGIALIAVLTGAGFLIFWSMHRTTVQNALADKNALESSEGSIRDGTTVVYEETPSTTALAIYNATILANNTKFDAINSTRNDTSSTTSNESNESSSIYWQTQAQDTVRQKVKQKLNENIAKNVIFFLGDGMSIATITAARIYSGQKSGRSGEESTLSFEKFPFTGLSKTYCVDKQVADSACSGTAYMCGVKGNFHTIGVNARVNLNDCAASNDPENQVKSLLHWAQLAKKLTGIVTTTRITHASPATAYAHVSNRIFESDARVKANGSDPVECVDIGRQLIENEPGKNLNVIFGGGRLGLLPNTKLDSDGMSGGRLDGRNLINEWIGSKTRGQFVTDREELIKLDLQNVDHVLGLFASSHMDFNLDADRSKQPNLAEMTETAIKLLQQGGNGFVLFVEGGLIDKAHHSATAMKALDETVEFSLAIERALNLTNPADTLIVATADHSHTMSIAGYPDRGNPIEGLNSHMSGLDNLPMTTLSYATGPNFNQTFPDKNGQRANLTGTAFDKNSVYPGLFPTENEYHAGDDVAVYATGCMSHLFSGVYEQNTIPHLISYAACLGDGLTACNEQN